MWWILVILILIYLIYTTLRRPYQFWIKKGVKQGNPTIFFGDNWGITMKKQSCAEMTQMIYNISSDARYVGMYQFHLPTLLIRDPELVKQITVKDFDHFVNHRPIIPESFDPLWSRNLFALNDQNWKNMRAALSPTFTGSKMKFMFSLMSEIGEQFAQYFLKKNQNVIEMEMKETFIRFTNDVIASTAFGVKCDSLQEQNNEFYLMGKELTTTFIGIRAFLKFIAFNLIPSLCKLLKLSVFSKKVSNFFTKVIKENIRSREQHNIVRPDMIHLLMEARKNGLKYEEDKSGEDTEFAAVQESEITKNSTSSPQTLTDIDITAQALVFFLGGFDTVSSAMCFMCYELAINPHVQDRLRKEVDDTSKSGKLTYENLMGMKYMDMVVSETLRLWPAVGSIDRICTKPYTIEPKRPEENPLHLEKNSAVWVPVYGLHRDPKYFPEPNRFDPERFSNENKCTIIPYTYLPFGSGPRNCIGSRFALLETKVLFYYILQHFEIVPVEKTAIPLVLSKGVFNLNSEKGFWLGLKHRTK